MPNFVLKEETIGGLYDLLAERGRQPVTPAKGGGEQNTSPATEVVKAGALIGASPHPHYEGLLLHCRDLTDHPNISGNAVVLAPLDADAELVEGKEYLATRRGTSPDGRPLYWVQKAPECDLQIEIITGAAMSGCSIRFTKQRYKLLCDATVEAVGSPSTFDVDLPTICIEVPIGDGTIDCETRTLTFTMQKHRVVSCGAACP